MQKITRYLMLFVATFSLAFSAKSQTGNNCSSAINISLSTSSSTCLSNSIGSASVWYKFTAIRSVTNFVVKNNTAQAAVIGDAHVYTGACNSLVELGATIDAQADSLKIFINILSAGQTYYIRLDKNAGSGAATFTVCSTPAEQLPWQVTGNDVQFAGKIGATSATLSTLAGSGNRLVQTDAAGNLLSFPMGNSSQVLLGNGTWGSLPGVPYTVSGGNTTFGGSVTANGLTSIGDITGENLTINSNSTFNGRMNVNSFSGGGKRLLMTADDGSIFALNSGNPHDVLFGNGTWGSFPQAYQPWAPNQDATAINYDGYVGINNPDPQYELDVAGNAYVSGNLYVGRGVVISQSTAVNPKLLIQASELLTSKLNVDTISMDSSARFTGTAVFENQVSLRDQLKVANNATFSSAVSVQTALRVGGAATFSTSIDVGQNLTFKNASAGIGYVPGGSTVPPVAQNAGNLVLSANTNVWGGLNVSSLATGSSDLSEVYVDGNGNLKLVGGGGGGGGLSCVNNSLNWNLGGNNIGTFITSGKTPMAGTCDNYDFILKAHNIPYMWIKPDGKIGIGTSAPVATLDVMTDGISNPFNVSNLATTSNLFTVGSDGATTINNTSTSAPLTVKNASGTLLKVTNNAVNIPSVINGNNPYSNYNTVMVDNQTGDLVPGPPIQNVSSLAWTFGGNSSSGAALGSNDGTDLPFITGTGTEKMRINAAGDVIIPSVKSTTAPLSSLLVDASGKLVTGGPVSGTSASAWILGGNTIGNSSPTRQFIGTLDNNDLAIKSNNIEVVTINSSSNSPININSISLNGNQLLLSGNGDPSHGLATFSTFNYFDFVNHNSITSPTINGPVLFGYGGGALGTNQMVNGSTGNPPAHTNIALRWNDKGQVFIGSKTPVAGQHENSALSVFGDITATAIFVTDPAAKWSDFVFEKDYKLMSISDLENFYVTNHHLPDVPSTKEVQVNGNNLAETDAILLQKIEELTLYIVQQQKEIENLKKQVKK